jgi:putative NIF3 family GTP cyclohydrolase 1 type 2
MTVHDIVRIITGAVNAVAPEHTVDSLKIGNPEMEVTGIVIAFTATPDVFRKAAELGANLVVTHEPTFYDHRDDISWQKEHSVYGKKRELALQSGMAVWRFHDLPHLNMPDFIMQGMDEALGWSGFQDKTHPWVYSIPEIGLLPLAEHIKQVLGCAAVRLVGRDNLKVRRIAFVPGACPIESQMEAMLAGVDAMVVGETCEWLVCEYFRDALQLGFDLGLVVIGHCNSEEEGMRHVAGWLRPLFPGLDITFVPVGDPLRSI